MYLSAAIPGVDPRDIRGNNTGFANFCRQFLARDGGIEQHLFAAPNMTGDSKSTYKRITHQSQQKISRPYFVVRFFYG